jgi:hypothetical protein
MTHISSRSGSDKSKYMKFLHAQGYSMLDPCLSGVITNQLSRLTESQPRIHRGAGIAANTSVRSALVAIVVIEHNTEVTP